MLTLWVRTHFLVVFSFRAWQQPGWQRICPCGSERGWKCAMVAPVRLQTEQWWVTCLTSDPFASPCLVILEEGCLLPKVSLPFMGPQRVGHNGSDSAHTHTWRAGEGVKYFYLHRRKLHQEGKNTFSLWGISFFFFGEEFLMKHCDYVPLRKGGVRIILNMLGLFEYVRHIFEYVLV